MANLSDLPPELVLRMLSFLPIPSLHAMQVLSRLWNGFFHTHERLIYLRAACYHRFISNTNVPLSEARSVYPGCVKKEVDSWRSLCELYTAISMWVKKLSAP